MSEETFLLPPSEFKALKDTINLSNINTISAASLFEQLDLW
jgi:hypothetical protein